MRVTGVTREMRECIQDCLDCSGASTEAVNHCLRAGGARAGAWHIRLLLDCEASCAVSAGFMLRGSEFHARMCDVCSEVCRAAGESCEEVAGGDELLLRCAEICRRTAESCRRIAMAMA